MSGSAQSVEPAWDSLSPSLSAPSPLVLSLSQNKFFLKERKYLQMQMLNIMSYGGLREGTAEKKQKKKRSMYVQVCVREREKRESKKLQ